MCRSESSRQADDVVRSVLLEDVFDSDELINPDEDQPKQEEKLGDTENTQNDTKET